MKYERDGGGRNLNYHCKFMWTNTGNKDSVIGPIIPLSRALQCTIFTMWYTLLSQRFPLRGIDDPVLSLPPPTPYFMTSPCKEMFHKNFSIHQSVSNQISYNSNERDVFLLFTSCPQFLPQMCQPRTPFESQLGHVYIFMWMPNVNFHATVL